MSGDMYARSTPHVGYPRDASSLTTKTPLYKFYRPSLTHTIRTAPQQHTNIYRTIQSLNGMLKARFLSVMRCADAIFVGKNSRRALRYYAVFVGNLRHSIQQMELRITQGSELLGKYTVSPTADRHTVTYSTEHTVLLSLANLAVTWSIGSYGQINHILILAKIFLLSLHPQRIVRRNRSKFRCLDIRSRRSPLPTIIITTPRNTRQRITVSGAPTLGLRETDTCVECVGLDI